MSSACKRSSRRESSGTCSAKNHSSRGCPYEGSFRRGVATDVGQPDFAPRPTTARGVVPALSRRLCPAIDEQSLAIFWREIPVLNLEKKHKGLAAKVGSAIILACKHGCAGTVCVADNDDDDGRLARLEQGMTAAPDSHA